MAVATLPFPSTQPLTLDQYLHTSYHPDRDFVDGTIEERNMGEYEHSILQMALGSWFFNHRAEWQIRVTSEYRTRVSQNRVRIPDISIIPHEGPLEKVRVTPAILNIEILSPEDRLSRVLTRLNDYLAMGVPHLWLIDPIERAAFIYTATGLRLVEGPRLAIPDSPIYIDLPELFTALD